VAGFQGVSADSKDITTLGRGGSDTTAVALAAALHADICEIYTDVDGIFTADPRIVHTARKIDRISNEEMLEMAACGAKILHLRCVEYARRFDMPIHVRSSFSYREGTLVVTQPSDEQGDTVEAPIIAGVAHDRSEAKITVVGVPDHPGTAAEIFQACADAEINIDMIVQNVSAVETGLTDISFTLPMTDGKIGVQALKRIQPSVGFASLLYDDHIGKLSARRCRHAITPRRVRHALQGARRCGHQHRDDLHLGDPGLGRHPGRPARRRSTRCAHGLWS